MENPSGVFLSAMLLADSVPALAGIIANVPIVLGPELCEALSKFLCLYHHLLKNPQKVEIIISVLPLKGRILSK